MGSFVVGAVLFLAICHLSIGDNVVERRCAFRNPIRDDSQCTTSSECPVPEGECPVYLEHETDCHKFYECSNGRKCLFTCPSNLVFNTNLNVCDYPENFSCNKRKCPVPDPIAYSVYFPHETNCNLFYQCSNGTPVLQKCPDGLHFNPRLNVCDYPADAKCASA